MQALAILDVHMRLSIGRVRIAGLPGAFNHLPPPPGEWAKALFSMHEKFTVRGLRHSASKGFPLEELPGRLRTSEPRKWTRRPHDCLDGLPRPDRGGQAGSRES